VAGWSPPSAMDDGQRCVSPQRHGALEGWEQDYTYTGLGFFLGKRLVLVFASSPSYPFFFPASVLPTSGVEAAHVPLCTPAMTSENIGCAEVMQGLLANNRQTPNWMMYCRFFFLHVACPVII